MYPNATVKGYELEVEEGRTLYEIERTSRGSVVEYEIQIVSGKTKRSLVVDPGGNILKKKKAGEKKEKND